MKQPAIQFYVGDWKKDPTVSCLSYAARGLWFEILLLMYESPHRGYLLLESGFPMSVVQIARATGGEIAEVNELLSEMKQAGTYSANEPGKDWFREDLPEGVLVNRRMVRDEHIRQVRSEAGRTGGGNPNFVSGFVKTKSLTNDGQNAGTRPDKLPAWLPGANPQSAQSPPPSAPGVTGDAESDAEDAFVKTKSLTKSLTKTGSSSSSSSSDNNVNDVADDSRPNSLHVVNGTPGPTTPTPPSELTPEHAARKLINTLAPRHPTPGNIGKAVQAATALLQNAEHIRKRCQRMIDSHAAYVVWWTAEAKINPNIFIPQLHRWFQSGDWMHPPGEQSIHRQPPSSETQPQRKSARKAAWERA